MLQCTVRSLTGMHKGNSTTEMNDYSPRVTFTMDGMLYEINSKADNIGKLQDWFGRAKS